VGALAYFMLGLWLGWSYEDSKVLVAKPAPSLG
jgi:hypothetical protein